MDAFWPRDLPIFFIVLTTLVTTLVLAFAITRLTNPRIARFSAWLLVVVSTIAIERLSTHEPAGLRMVAIILALLWSMKAVVSVEAVADDQPRLPALPWFGFASGWLGMRPSLFVRLGSPPRSGARALFATGLVHLLSGTLLIALGRWIAGAGVGLSTEEDHLLATPPILIGLSLVLHFGFINWMAGFWRLLGVDARPLFKAPLQSRSLNEFWGKRWNLAFVEMMAIAFYRQLHRRLGRPAAVLAAFAFSGLLHELAISVPVKAGFGLPTLYFVSHGFLVLLEERFVNYGIPITRLGWLSRCWTFIWLVIPLPLVFHVPFLRGVVWPMVGLVVYDAMSISP